MLAHCQSAAQDRMPKRFSPFVFLVSVEAPGRSERSKRSSEAIYWVKASSDLILGLPTVTHLPKCGLAKFAGLSDLSHRLLANASKLSGNGHLVDKIPTSTMTQGPLAPVNGIPVLAAHLPECNINIICLESPAASASPLGESLPSLGGSPAVNALPCRPLQLRQRELVTAAIDERLDASVKAQIRAKTAYRLA